MGSANQDGGGQVTRIFRSGLAAMSEDRARANAARIAEYENRLRAQPGDQHARIALTRCFETAGRFSAALSTLEEGITQTPPSRAVWWNLIYSLNEAGRADDARALAARAVSIFPEHLEFRLASRLLVPVLYDSDDEIDTWRKRFIEGLGECEREAVSDDQETAAEDLRGLGHWTNFYLAYQGRNDLELQKRYGAFASRIVAAAGFRSPSFSGPEPGSRLRIGFASPHLSSHSVGRMFLGWVRHLDRARFEVLSYHIGEDDDSTTQRYRAHSDSFFHSTDLKSIVHRISEDKLDVLVHLDIGTTPLMTQLAAIRLAPQQCTSWGHPETSGLPTIDYFLSSEMMEPADGDSHYSESLVRLPGIGAAYEEPAIPRPFMTATRADFGIAERAIVFACCQSPFKYLPSYDHVLTSIARSVPDSQFVFVVGNDVLSKKFATRLTRAFMSVGLDWSKHCVILPWQSYFDYLQLYALSDVFLDTIGFSSSSTTLEAIACGLPVVTCPGEFMRGRMTLGILTAMGVSETIAQSESEFVDISVRLALDPEFRQKVQSMMLEPRRRASVFEDMSSVTALEDFFTRIAARSS